MRRGTRRSSRTSRSVGTETQGSVSGGSRQSGSLAATAIHVPMVRESRATSPSRSPQACWPDQPHTPGMWPGRSRSGSHIGCRPRRVAVSSYQQQRRPPPPRLDRTGHGLCTPPPDGLEPSAHTITIPLYPQSDGFKGGTVALRHKATGRSPAVPASVAPLPPSSPDARGSPACADLRVQHRPLVEGQQVEAMGMRAPRTGDGQCSRSLGGCPSRALWQRCRSK